MTFTALRFIGGPVSAVPPEPVNETAVAPGTKPVPMSVTDRVEPGVPVDGDIDVAIGAVEPAAPDDCDREVSAGIANMKAAKAAVR